MIKEKRELEEMLNELESSQLEVCLVPAKWKKHEGHMVRCTVNKNCEWYRKFCACYFSTRMRKSAKHDTKIKRKNVLTTLRFIVNGGKSRSQYLSHFVSIARSRIKHANSKKIVFVDFSENNFLTVNENPF